MNTNLQSLKKSFAGVTLLRMVGLPLALLANVVLARILSISEFGIFAFSISLVTVLAVPVCGGLPILLTREIAIYSSEKNWPAYRALVVTAHKWVITVAALVNLLLLVWWLSTGRQQSDMVLFVALILPILGFSAIRNGILKGLGYPALSEAPLAVMQPTFLLITYLALATIGLASAANALWLYFANSIVIFAFGVVLLNRVQPARISWKRGDKGEMGRWLKSLIPFTLLSATNTLSTQFSILLLGALGNLEAVAQLSVAQRGALLVTMPLTIMNAVVAPYFVRALQSKEPGELRNVARHSARLTFLVALPFGLILILFGRPLIAWTFGTPYDQGAYLPLVLIVLAQLISVALGSGGLILAMSGNEKHTLYSQVVFLIVAGAVSISLVGTFGAIGAAIGIATGVIVTNLYTFLMVRSKLSISSAIF
jgi:O-antigen/teichoic acid export membrane protein